MKQQMNARFLGKAEKTGIQYFMRQF